MLDSYVMYYLVGVLVVSVVSTIYLYSLIEKRARAGTKRLSTVEWEVKNTNNNIESIRTQLHDTHMMVASQLDRIVRLEQAETGYDWPEVRDEDYSGVEYSADNFVYTIGIEKPAKKKGVVAKQLSSRNNKGGKKNVRKRK